MIWLTLAQHVQCTNALIAIIDAEAKARGRHWSDTALDMIASSRLRNLTRGKSSFDEVWAAIKIEADLVEATL